MILILTTDVTPRHSYIFGYLFRTFCGMECTFRDPAIVDTLPPGLPVINYSELPIEGTFHIRPHGLLSAKGIPSAPAFVDLSGHLPFFYPCQDADHPFDMFSASFYLLSRAEEYHGKATDAFGRYHHIHALAYRYDFLDLPLIDAWMMDLREGLQQRFPSIRFRIPQTEYQLTYDVDLAWAVRSKGLPRLIGGLMKTGLKGQFQALMASIRVLRGRQQDPYDCYDRLDGLHSTFGIHPIYFFLLAKKLQGVDRNPDPDREEVKKLVRRHAGIYRIGMHPSWQSGDDPEIFRSEKKCLEQMIGQTVRRSRQHYLRMQLPNTYRQLIDQGITDDHSMGYGTINGFRASVSRPFPWYDLPEERETSLMVHPFCFMDATAFHELGMSAGEAYVQLEGYLKSVRAVGGCMTTVFHNSMLGTASLYDGWYEMYLRYMAVVSDPSSGSSGVLPG